MKTCTKCYQEKHFDDFHKDRSTKDGLYPSCKLCNKGKSADKESKAVYDKEYRKNIGWKKAANHYGTTPEFLELLYRHQEGLCAICACPETVVHPSGAVKRLAIDHEHSTDTIRGFLCQKHNQGLGLFSDNIEFLRAAIIYLERASKIPELIQSL